MSKYHYVYHSYEEWGRDYIGVRSCNCLPEKDTKYFGSFKDKTFKPTRKTVLFVCETRKEATEIEIKLHDFFDVAVNSKFANKSKQTSTKFDTTGIPTTEETKRKQSEANSGKTRTEEQKKRMSGENHPMYGVIRKAHSERMTGENNPMYGVPHTEEWKQAMSERMTGEKHPMYGVPRTEAQNKAQSKVGKASGSQKWQSTVDGFVSNAPRVATHNKKNGWDPNARTRIS